MALPVSAHLATLGVSLAGLCGIEAERDPLCGELPVLLGRHRHHHQAQGAVQQQDLQLRHAQGQAHQGQGGRRTRSKWLFKSVNDNPLKGGGLSGWQQLLLPT